MSKKHLVFTAIVLKMCWGHYFHHHQPHRQFGLFVRLQWLVCCWIKQKSINYMTCTVPLTFIGTLANCVQCFESLFFLFSFYFIFQNIFYIYMDKMGNHTKTSVKQLHVIRILIELMTKQMDFDSMIPSMILISFFFFYKINNITLFFGCLQPLWRPHFQTNS